MSARPANRSDAWARLQAHHESMRHVHMRDLFAADGARFERLSVEACGLLLDYSKHRVTDETLARLLELARAADLEQARARLFAGEPVNSTEGRAALHMALRYRDDGPFPRADFDVMPEVRAVLARMRRFADAVRGGEWRGFGGERIRALVNIGIGGSDLGPAMAAHALAPWKHEALDAHFVSNIDSAHLARTLARLDPETTLFVIASKTFGTLETLTNARSARRWLVEHFGDERAVARHFVAVSTAAERVAAFGIDTENMFGFWDWVGGRYSLWSAIGLPVATLIGMDAFEEFLEGGAGMDAHFASAPLERNMPVVMGLLGLWYRNFFRAPTHAVLAYDYALARFADYLQQLEMESNGKRVTHDGEPVEHETCPIVWGGLGNNGQHAFYQLLHQGTAMAPADLIVPLASQYPLPGHETACLANAFAQAEALLHGRTLEEARAELRGGGLDEDALEAQAPHRVLPGNQPTSMLVYERLTPRVLGALVALYEHKVFTQSVCWGINPFDQWGVELGKQLAAVIASELEGEEPVREHDASTSALIARARSGRSRGGR